MIYSRIVGSGSYLPPRIVDNDEFDTMVEASPTAARKASAQ